MNRLSLGLVLKTLIGVPLVAFALLTVVQLPKLWLMTGGDPRLIILGALQGGLPVLPFVFYALSLLAAADMVRRMRTDEPLEPRLYRGLELTGGGLIAGAVALYAAHSDWAWRHVYGNEVAQSAGHLNFPLFALITALLGLILIGAARRIRRVQAQRLALSAELDQYV